MFWYIVTWSCNYVAVILFSLPVCTRMIGFWGGFFTPRKRRRVVKHLLTNCGPLLVNIYGGIPNRMTQLSRNIVAICVQLISAVSIARVNFENWSATMSTCWFPVLIPDSGPKMAMVANSRVPQLWRAEGSLFLSLEIHFWAHWLHLPTAVYTSFALCRLWNCCPIVSYIGLFLGCPASAGSDISIWWSR